MGYGIVLLMTLRAMFTTERLILRPYSDSDMDEVFEFSNTYNIQLTTNPFFAVPTVPKGKDGLSGMVGNICDS